MQVFFQDKMATAREELVWPAFPTPAASLRLSVVQQLEESQWWPHELLERQQLLQLDKLIRHAARTVPFYRQRLKNCGWRADEVITSAAFREIPVLTRTEVNAAGAELNSDRIPEGHGRTGKITTSGSTGNPVSVLKTGWTQIIWDAITLRDHYWRKRDFSRKLASIRHFPPGQATPPDGRCIDNWGAPVSLIYSSGKLYGLNIRSTSGEQLDWLLKVNPEYLLTFPSSAEAMAHLSIKHGRLPEKLREVRTIGESLSPETRKTVREAWGVDITDCYSAQEVGYIALQSPHSEHYLVQSESVYVEILNDEGRPCREGETGRVVVTPLQNFATPLIRYELDDYAEVGAPSPCGRGLPVLNRIYGRSRNMLAMPNGDRRFAALGIKDFNTGHDGKIRGYQAVQKTPEQLMVKLVMEEAYTAGEEEALKEHMRQRLGYPFSIRFEYVDEIPRSAGGKYEDFRCEVPYD